MALYAGILQVRITLANVPDPARFAFHKLWTSERRPVAEQTKARKDLAQAARLLEVLLEDRPGDLVVAWEPVAGSKSPRRRILAAARRLEPALRRRLAEVVSEPGFAVEEPG